MKITSKILSIPPYLSTTWQNISSLHVKPEGSLFTLVVVLETQAQVEIPGLHKETIDEIFEAHAKSSETKPEAADPTQGPFHFSLPFNKDALGGLADINTSMEHNPDQADLPLIPNEVLSKITMIAKAFGLEDLSTFKNPQTDCNCIYCQIARAVGNRGMEDSEEEVLEEELTFRSNWEVKEIDKDLYSVTNTLDTNETYSVFLGTPLGCTCGSKNCDHIKAVLKS